MRPTATQPGSAGGGVKGREPGSKVQVFTILTCPSNNKRVTEEVQVRRKLDKEARIQDTPEGLLRWMGTGTSTRAWRSLTVGF